jgi:transposase
MNTDWMSDARKIPDDVMNYLRRIAVYAVIDRHLNPERIANVFNISRSCIYEWIRWYRDGGDDALDTRHAPGAFPVMTSEIDCWLKDTILKKTPEDFGYETNLWTLKIIAAVLKEKFGIHVYESTVANHLHRMKLSCQVPEHRVRERNPFQIAYYLNKKWPKIQMLADKMGADIGFEDEAGIAMMTRSGRSWGAVNTPPIVPATDRRGGYNVLSAITTTGRIYYKIKDEHVDSDIYIEFLEMILREQKRPIILIVDRASFHRSKKVREFLRAHRCKIRMLFLPAHAPELNPAEQVWNEIKYRKLGRQPIVDKIDLRARMGILFQELKKNTVKILSFFHLKNTKYVLSGEST